jgi:hypothetical protein
MDVNSVSVNDGWLGELFQDQTHGGKSCLIRHPRGRNVDLPLDCGTKLGPRCWACSVVYTCLSVNLSLQLFTVSITNGYRDPSPQNIMDPAKLAKLQAQAAANRIGE